MKLIHMCSIALFVTASFPVLGQDMGSQAPLVIAPRQDATTTVLPANTEVLLSMNETLTTKGDSLKEGDTFYMSVVHDVMLGDYVIIPKGARAAGNVKWLTSKGAFGKSGKMEIELRYVEVGGRRVPLVGEFRQEGEGNTVATVGGVIAAGVFAAFITGKSGVIPAGRELMVRTKEELPVQLAGATPKATAMMVTKAADPVAPVPTEAPQPAAQPSQQ